MQYQIENGVHTISNEAYHGSQGISRSALMEFKRSPFHYWFKYLNPDATEESPTPQMKLGEYVHALVLEPQHFHERYIVKPYEMELPKVGLLKEVGREEYERQKSAREEVRAANELMMNEFIKNAQGKQIISQDLYQEAKDIADTVMRHEVAKSLFDGVKAEHSIYFTHKATGLQCKVRPDAWMGSVVTDLKTCADASFYTFQSTAYKGGYFIQAAMTKQALASIGIELEKFIFFCVEKTGGMPCVYYAVDDESMYLAEREFDNLMFKLADCIESNNWDSYQSKDLRYPNYARYEE